ncbi:glycosyltransferase family 4 protein [soil metagenome]
MNHDSSQKPRVALIYDRVNTRYGGAEQVLLQLHRIFPDAPLFTSVYDPLKAVWASSIDVRASFIQKIPFLKNFHRSLVFLMPLAFENFNLKEFDIVISITSAEAKGVLSSPDQLHVCYLLTPTRYLWSHQAEYQKHWLTGGIRKIVFRYLKWWDEAAIYRPDVIIPISKLIQVRTEQYYHRKTLSVIYPPVSFEKSEEDKSIENFPENFYLIVARLVSYKRVDLAINACQKLNRNLVIIGEGPDKARLQHLAKNTDSLAKITFLSNLSQAVVQSYYQRCTAFLAPGEEDFGIATLEASLSGKPVIVFNKSGAAELIKDTETGILLQKQTVDELTESIKKIESTTWIKRQIQESVSGLDAVQFQSQFKRVILEQWNLFKKGNL